MRRRIINITIRVEKRLIFNQTSVGGLGFFPRGVSAVRYGLNPVEPLIKGPAEWRNYFVCVSIHEHVYPVRFFCLEMTWLDLNNQYIVIFDIP